MLAILHLLIIQSNQNDQHGGQSIPNFDYSMAKGVAKTYKRCYRQNIVRSIAIHNSDLNVEDLDAKVREYMDRLEAKGLTPVLADNNGYKEAEQKELAKFIPQEMIEKVQDFTAKLSLKETDRATYQAMEALIHNLNTMNSRAGAQTPFSSINYGTDTSPEGRMVIKNILLANEAGLGNGETPNFPNSYIQD